MLAEMALLSLAGYVVNALTRGLSHSQTVQSLNDQANELTKDIVLRVRLAQGAADRQRAVDLIGEEAVRLLRLLDDQRRLGLISYSDFEVRAEAIVLEALAAQQAVQSGSAIPEGQLRRNCPHCGGPVVGNDTNVCQHCGQSMLKNRCPKCGRFYYGDQSSCQCGQAASSSSPTGGERTAAPTAARQTPKLPVASQSAAELKAEEVRRQRREAAQRAEEERKATAARNAQVRQAVEAAEKAKAKKAARAAARQASKAAKESEAEKSARVAEMEGRVFTGGLHPQYSRSIADALEEIASNPDEHHRGIARSLQTVGFSGKAAQKVMAGLYPGDTVDRVAKTVDQPI